MESSFYTFRANISAEDIYVLYENEGFRILVTLTPEMNDASNKPSLHLHYIFYPNFTSSDRSWKSVYLDVNLFTTQAFYWYFHLNLNYLWYG